MEFIIKLGLIGIGMTVAMHGIMIAITLISLIITAIVALFTKEDDD